MRKRVPVPREKRSPLPEFTPVPRKYRHDGWTPERQKAFIEALADCGSISRAAAQVNMAQANCYQLRRAPGAESFRVAWEAALDFGVKRLKDVAFERAIEGQLHPVIRGGKLFGFTRKKNDALLMFLLRHYGQDANGKRTTINYFSTKASAGASAGAAGGEAAALAGAEASTTTVRTVIDGSGEGGRNLDEAAAVMEGFSGVAIDAEAEAAIAAALEACAARARAAEEAVGEVAADFAQLDPDASFVPVPDDGNPYRGPLERVEPCEVSVPFKSGEAHWTQTGAEMPEWVCEVLDAREAAAALPAPSPPPAPPPAKPARRRRNPKSAS